MRFNGAPSGDYLLNIENQFGVITGSGLPLKTQIRLDSFSPAGGSTRGGTLLTLNGAHFGNVPTDNPVKIGNQICFVQETSEFEIKCRIAVDGSQEPNTSEIIIFAKASEEMVCNVGVEGDGCEFVFSNPLADLISITESFDSTSNTIQLTVTGSGFTDGDTANTELYLDGVKQETVSVSQPADLGTAVFNVVYADDADVTNIVFYTQEGLPASDLASVTLTPGLVKIDAGELDGFSGNQNGSQAGSILRVTGVGFGPGTEDLNLHHVQNNTDICIDIEITGYGEFTCITGPSTIYNSDTIELAIGNSEYPCLNSDPTLCSLEQLIGSGATISSFD